MGKKYLAMLFLMLASGIFPHSLFAVEINTIIVDHLSKAKAYEEKAKVYEKLILEHQQMIDERHKNYDTSGYPASSTGSGIGTRRWSDSLTPLMLGQMHRCTSFSKSRHENRNLTYGLGLDSGAFL